MYIDHYITLGKTKLLLLLVNSGNSGTFEKWKGYLH